jgi:ribosomal protein S18 acetylase RimI-like enzyme
VASYLLGMDLRRALPTDLPLLAPLFDAYRQFYRQPSDPGRAAAFLQERLQRDESVIFLALEGEECAGFVQLYPSFWSVAACRSWILNDLFVAARFRGRGVGRALLERARSHAESTGALGMSLATQRSNRTAQRLYESLGWVRDEEFLHYELELPSG